MKVAFFRMISALTLLGAVAGCSEHREPPMERLELVSRFFRSVRTGDFEAAARQGRKLYAMDRNNGFLLHLVTIHESNVFLRNAQKALNSGDVEQALRILGDGCRRYPENRTLSMYRTRVSQLRNAKKLMRDMELAQSAAAMSASLTAAYTGLGANMSPKLKAYFKRYEAQIAKTAERERREAKKAETLLPPPAKEQKSDKSAAATPVGAAAPKREDVAPPPPIMVPAEPGTPPEPTVAVPPQGTKR